MTELSVWRVEWLRLVRTRRLVALVGTFVVLGLTDPLFARYRSTLFTSLTAAIPGSRITLPPPVPADALTGYNGNATLVGLVVVVVITASACAIDAKPALAVFYRTRTVGFGQLLLPRVAVSAAAAVAAYVVGALAAWYETALLIGAPDLGAMAQGAAAAALYLLFAVAVTALATTLTRGPAGTLGITLVVVFGGQLLGQLSTVSRWVPAALAAAPDALQRHTAPDHYQRAIAVTVALIAGCIALAVKRGAHREPVDA
jgi:ABC-2 type transport system permease protein